MSWYNPCLHVRTEAGPRRPLRPLGEKGGQVAAGTTIVSISTTPMGWEKTAPSESRPASSSAPKIRAFRSSRVYSFSRTGDISRLT
jgi:hypothetical protein